MIIIFGLTIFTILDPLFFKVLLDEFFLGENDTIFYVVAVLYLVKTLFQSVIYLSNEYLSTYLNLLIGTSFRKNIFKNIIRVKGKEEKNINVGEIVVCFDRDLTNIQKLMSKSIFNNIMMLFKLIMVGLIMVLLGWQYFVCSILLIPLRLINNIFWLGKIIDKSNRVQKSISGLFDFLNEVFKNSRGIKIAAKEKYVERKFISKNRMMVKDAFNFYFVSWIVAISDEILKELDRIIMFGIGGYLLYKNQISFGTYIALAAYEKIFKDNLRDIILSLQHDFSQVVMSVNRLENLIKLEREEKKGRKIESINGEIELKNVEFRYSDENEKIFDNFNLKIKQGEKLAIVGESGSGKSTLINLILGIYQPSNGEVLIDGKKLNSDLDIGSFRKKLGIVMQENFFFSDTLRENLTLGEKIDDDEIFRILEMLKMQDVIGNDNDSLEIKLEDGASNFSGGQKQRLAIARMLLKNPDMVILDEATSALDNITEREVQNVLEKELEKKTVITIAHRLSTIENSDRILVLKQGKIIEEGTHKQLIENRGYYYSLINRKKDN